MPNTTTNHRPRKKKKTPVHEHALTVFFFTLRLCWTLTKLTLWAALGALLMFVAIVGMMTRGASN